MIFPNLYSQGTTDFTNNGIGLLADATKCRVTAELTGYYELEMDYPVGGLHYAEITDRAIIKARLPQVANPQLFEVYEITKPISGIVTVKAQHISYGMQGIPVSPFTAGGVVSALAEIKNHAAIDCPFDFLTDKDTTGVYTVKEPTPMSLCLRGQQGSIVDTYAGELELDNYKVKLLNRRGADRGVVIRYGKNLTDLKQQQNCSDVASGVYPYWADIETGETVELPEKIVKAPVDLPFERVQVLDLTAQFETKPTEEQLRNRATKYVKDNKIWLPRVNLKVSFVQLEQTAEYKGSALLERVELGDTVSVEFPRLGVSSKARATKLTYDVLLGRIDKVQLGGAAPSLADTIARQDRELQKVPTTSDIQKAVSNATNWITNGKGYMVAIKGPDDSWQEICSLDNPDIDTAMNVWRWNNGGFGYSSHGYNGPYETAITQDGAIVADFITTGTLSASLVKAGVLQSKDNGRTFYLDLEKGKLRGNFESVTIKGVNAVNEDQLSAVNDLVTDLQNQVDGVTESYFYDYTPTANNAPASSWTTEQQKKEHLGDRFYVTGDGSTAGNEYRWARTASGYDWQLIPNSGTAEALKKATDALALADSKIRMFGVQPFTPYDEGDLWARSDYPLLKCIKARDSGAFNASDWGYADYTASQLKITNDRITTEIGSVSGTANNALEKASTAEQTVEGFRQTVSNTETTANNADKKAGDALTAANSAKGTAGTALKTATTAKQTADAFSQTATRAENKADSAIRQSSQAAQTANSISARVDTKLDASSPSTSFGWELLSNRWEVRANGNTVFRVTPDGAYVSGEIQASSGKIGGWEINSQNWLIGTVPGGDLRTIMAPPGSAGTDGRVFLVGGGASNNYDYSFSVYQDGTFKSTKGYIGGWTIDKTSLNIEDPKNNKSLEISANNGLYGGMTGKKWYIRMNGDAYFENATVIGRIEAGTGKIGGWNIDKQILGNTLVSGVADGNRVGLAPGIDPANGNYKPKDGLCFWAGAYWYGGKVDYEKAPFRVYADGSLYAENGYFHGTVRAGKLEYGGGAGYVPEAGLSSGTREKLGYAVEAEKVITGQAYADHIRATNCTVSTFFYGGQVVRVPTTLKNPVSGKYEEYSVLAIRRTKEV